MYNFIKIRPTGVAASNLKHNLLDYIFDQKSNISDGQYDEYIRNLNQYGYFNYNNNYNRIHHNPIYNYKQNYYNQLNRNMCYQNRNYEMGNYYYHPLCNESGDYHWCEYNRRFGETLDAMAHFSCSSSNSSENSENFCENKSKTRKKMSRNPFKKNSIRNYVNYNQILEYFK